jgi:penicillin-binding protein 1A
MRLLYSFIFVTIILTSFGAGILFFLINNHAVDFSVLASHRTGRPSILLDDEGNEWGRFQLDKRDPIALGQIPAHAVQAFIAAEDWDFFNHSGVSWRGIIRSIIVNIYRGKKAQGASTITQQLVKLLFLDSKKTFERKVKEQICAMLVEQQCSKEQILETYLNHIYFGCGIYGVQAACQRFWGISICDISLEQAASLAAVLRSPAHYCPLLNPEACKKRRNVILNSMHKLGYISQEQYCNACAAPLQVRQESTVLAPHMFESIRIFLEDLLGKDALYRDGYVIQTTINSEMQRHAERVFREQCESLKKNLLPDIDGALISMDAQTGQIKVLIGGYNFNHSQFNRALQARRQMGSIFKPLIYAAALQEGKSFSDTEIDEPLHMNQSHGSVWSPRNYDEKFNGKITLAYALSHSNNIVAIKTLLNIGIPRVVDLAKACHLKGPFYNYPSLALGCVDATLIEAAGMFNVFANNGLYVQPHYIKWVKDSWGKKIWKSSVQSHYVLSARVVGQVSKVLQAALERIRVWWPDSWLPCQGMSKTGTTNDSRVCWYAGAIPGLTTLVYIGCDDNRSMGKDIYPLRTAFPIWLQCNKVFGIGKKFFAYDSSLKEVFIDENTGYKVRTQGQGTIAIFE